MIRVFFAGSFFCLGSILFETALLSNMDFLPAIPDIALLMLLYISFMNNNLLGESVGFTSGLMLDFISASPLGLNTLYRTIIGYIAGSLSPIMTMGKVFIPMLLALIATVVKALLILLISVLFRGIVQPYSLFDSVFWFELLANTFCAPLVFGFLHLFANVLTVNNEWKKTL